MRGGLTARLLMGVRQQICWKGLRARRLGGAAEKWLRQGGFHSCYSANPQDGLADLVVRSGWSRGNPDGAGGAEAVVGTLLCLLPVWLIAHPAALNVDGRCILDVIGPYAAIPAHCREM